MEKNDLGDYEKALLDNEYFSASNETPLPNKEEVVDIIEFLEFKSPYREPHPIEKKIGEFQIPELEY